MESFCIRAVDSRKRVSLGGSLWKTTFDIDDLPLLDDVSMSCERLRSQRTSSVPSTTGVACS